MANTLNLMGYGVYAVASRSLEKAKEFAKECKAEVAYGSYEALAQDEKVQLVYVATPHSEHFNNMMLLLKYKKPVLCEKAFTKSYDEALKVIESFKAQNVFVTEAIWTRYMPLRRTLDSVLAFGVIGEVKTVTANLCYKIDHKERLIKPELAGGALLDVGVYALNFAIMVLGSEVEVASSSCVLSPLGVDYQNSFTLRSKSGALAVLFSGMNCVSDRKGIIYGTNGRIEVENINNPASFTVMDLEGNVIKKEVAPKQLNGFEYEVQECIDSVLEGKVEAPSMKHEEILQVMQIMDSMLKSWGVVYPR